MGEMRRAIAREEQERGQQDRFASTLVIAASKGAAEYARNVIIGVNDRSRRIVRHNALRKTIENYFRPLPMAKA
jgi:hypothetical protein